MKFNIPVIILTALLTVNCSTVTKDTASEKNQVNDRIMDYIASFENKDMDLLERIFSHDDDIITFGTDADEKWIGWESRKTAFERMFETVHSFDIEYRDLDIKVHDSCLTAWFSVMMDFTVSTGEGTELIKGLRYTGVLEKRNDKWLFVQLHVAKPVEKQVLKY